MSMFDKGPGRMGMPQDDVITNLRQIRDNIPLLKRSFKKRKPKSARHLATKIM